MATATGTIGLESCGRTTCEANCSGTCNSNSWIAAWPHWTRCNSVHCNVQTSRPIPYYNHCGGDFWFRICGTSILAPAKLKDCGPVGSDLPSAYCKAGTYKAMACVNSTAFRSLCNGCRPSTIGRMWTLANNGA